MSFYDEILKYYNFKDIIISINDICFKEIMENDVIRKEFEICKEKLIANTFKYAKRQLKWIKNHLMQSNKIKKRIFCLEFEEYNLEIFEKKVVTKALEIISNYKENSFNIAKTLEKFEEFLYIDNENKKQKFSLKLSENWEKIFCEDCKKNINGQILYEEHLKSKKHVKRIISLKKKKRNDEFIQKKKIHKNE